MLFPMMLPRGHVLAMAGVTALIVGERLEAPATARWRWRGLGRGGPLCQGGDAGLDRGSFPKWSSGVGWTGRGDFPRVVQLRYFRVRTQPIQIDVDAAKVSATCCGVNLAFATVGSASK